MSERDRMFELASKSRCPFCGYQQPDYHDLIQTKRGIRWKYDRRTVVATGRCLSCGVCFDLTYTLADIVSAERR